MTYVKSPYKQGGIYNYNSPDEGADNQDQNQKLRSTNRFYKMKKQYLSLDIIDTVSYTHLTLPTKA